MGGTLIKAGIGVFLVVAAARFGGLATELLGRARESVQASELLTLDGQLAAWTVGRKRTRPPRDQAHFEEVVAGLCSRPAASGDVTQDRWGETYVYEKLGERPVAWRITSKGPDRALGTGDDLVLKRHEDNVQINKRPRVAIMEAAIEDKRQADQRFLRDLEPCSAEGARRRQAGRGLPRGEGPRPERGRGQGAPA